jgi:hypothetical protein
MVLFQTNGHWAKKRGDFSAFFRSLAVCLLRVGRGRALRADLSSLALCAYDKIGNIAHTPCE